MFAAVVALADQIAGHRLGLINPALYALAARHAPGIAPVASGNNTVTVDGVTVRGYSVHTDTTWSPAWARSTASIWYPN